jgi:predicted transcriptional regulator
MKIKFTKKEQEIVDMIDYSPEISTDELLKVIEIDSLELEKILTSLLNLNIIQSSMRKTEFGFERIYFKIRRNEEDEN